ncbi:hypothetical protein [Yeosuana sp. AK3]
MEQNNNNRTINICAKITPQEKIRYNEIAVSHGISTSEWVASILNIYQNGYRSNIITPEREQELLAKIDKLEKKNKRLMGMNKTITESKDFL